MSVAAIAGSSDLSGLAGLSGTTATAPTGGSGFASALGNAVDGLSGLQNTADALSVQAVTGDLTDIHQATLAATRAQVTMQLVSAVRNKGVDAFNSIMNMQA